MPTHQKVYARSIIRRLKTEVRGCPKQVLFLSPYLTSHTAETVISGANSEDSEIYTTFSAENFAARASSLKTVRRLLESGFDVYHLPGLHAKVVLMKEFASVGSQNLTAGGTHQREVSVALSDEREVEYLRSQIAQWFGDRKLITLEMVEDMEACLPSLRIKYIEFKKAIDATDEEIKVQEAIRENEQRLQEEERKSEEEARQIEAARELRAGLREQSQSLRAAIQSKEVRTSRTIYARLVTKDNHDKYGRYQSTYSTLERRWQDVSLLEWWIADERRKLVKRKRYLLMLLENGKLGWPAMNKTQITHFGYELRVSNPEQIGAHQYKFEYEFAINEEDLLTWNVEIKIGPITTYSSNRNPGVVVRGYFSLANLTIVSLSYEPHAAVESPEVTNLYSWIDGEKPEIQRLIKRDLLTPFVFVRNRAGNEARSFFQGQGEYFKLKLRKLDCYIFLTAEKHF